MFLFLKERPYWVLVFLSVGLWNCGSSSGTSSASSTTAFPSELAVASPLESSGSSGSLSRVMALTSGSHPAALSSYSEESDAIATILAAANVADCNFDPAGFLVQADNADCYGPEVAFENHPNYGEPADINITYPSNDGTVPPFDVGMWLPNEASTGEACSAAELNARMTGVGGTSMTALQAMASLFCVSKLNPEDADSDGIPVNESLDLVDEMNSAAVANSTGVVFTTATLAHSDSSGDDNYTYALVFTYNDGTDDHTISVNMTHIPSAGGTYQGRFSYDFDNAVGPSISGCSSSLKRAGSVLYGSDGTTLSLDARTAAYCDDQTDFFTDGLVDPEKNWGSDYNYLVASFDPSSMAGNYAYTWEAGVDGTTRVFNINLTETAGLLTGTAYYGFGAASADTDGSIDGFICNWAGPGNDHTYADLAQKQVITGDADGFFTATSSLLTYAPVNGCDYNGIGGFKYDTDADGLTSDEVSTAVNNNLADLTDITSSSFVLPTPPENF